jgi:hypothetical protein
MTLGQTKAVMLARKAPAELVVTVTTFFVAQGCCGTTQLVREHSMTFSVVFGRNPVPVRWVVVFTIRLLGFATMCGIAAAEAAPVARSGVAAARLAAIITLASLLTPACFMTVSLLRGYLDCPSV